METTLCDLCGLKVKASSSLTLFRITSAAVLAPTTVLVFASAFGVAGLGCRALRGALLVCVLLMLVAALALL